MLIAVSFILLLHHHPSTSMRQDSFLISSLERALYCPDRQPPTLPVLAMSPKRYSQLAAMVRNLMNTKPCDRNQAMMYYDLNDETSWPFCVFGYCYNNRCNCVPHYAGHNCAIYTDKCWIMYCFITSCNPDHQSLHCNCHPELYGLPVKTMDYWYDEGLSNKFLSPPPDWQDELTGTRLNVPAIFYNNDDDNLGISKTGIHTWEASMYAKQGSMPVNDLPYEAPVVVGRFKAPKDESSFEAPKVVNSFEAPKVADSFKAPKVADRFEAPKVVDRQRVDGSLESSQVVGSFQEDEKIPSRTSLISGQQKSQNTNSDDQEQTPIRTSLTAETRPKNTNLQSPEPDNSDYEIDDQEQTPIRTSLTAGRPRSKNTNIQNPEPVRSDYEIDDQKRSRGRTSMTGGRPRSKNTNIQNPQPVWSGNQEEDQDEDEAEEDVKEAMEEMENGSSASLTAFETCYTIMSLYVLLWVWPYL